MTLLVLIALPGAPTFAAGDLCIAKSDWVTGSPQLTDGDVSGDAGYTGGTRAELGKVETDGVPYAGFLRMVEDRDDSHVWLGLEIKGIASAIFSSDDTVLIAFSTGSGTDTLIKIRPFSSSNTTLATPDEFVVRTRPAGGTGKEPWTDVSPPTWAAPNTRKVVDDDKIAWVLELKIPKVASGGSIADGIFFGAPVTDPTTGATLKMYVNVIRTTGTFSSLAAETPWPRDALIEDIIDQPIWDLDSTTYSPIPPPSSWADVSLGNRDQCTGVSLAWQDIGTTNTPESTIRLHRPGGSPLTPGQCPPASGQEGDVSVTNTFKARPRRSDAGTPASDITVTYKIAKWGIPGLEECGIGVSSPNCWSLVATSGVGSITSGTAAGTTTFNAPWQPNYETSCNYLGNTDNCMIATMSSSDPDVRFLNDAVRRNMSFVTASRFEQEAAISARGYGAPANGADKHRFLVVAQHRLDEYYKEGDRFFSRESLARRRSAGESAIGSNFAAGIGSDIFIPADGETDGYREAMTWIARGYLLSSSRIKLGETIYTLADDVGGFGYVASHDGAEADWSQSLTGDDLMSTDDPNAYLVDIEPGSETLVNTVIEAEDYRFAVHGVVGQAYPGSGLSSLVDSGPSVLLGLEYLINRRVSTELALGHHSFDDGGLGTDLDILSVSANLRYYARFNNSTAFLVGGIGSFRQDPGSTDFGISAGFGYQYRLARRLRLEATYMYQDVSASSPSVAFSTVQVGLRYVF